MITRLQPTKRSRWAGPPVFVNMVMSILPFCTLIPEPQVVITEADLPGLEIIRVVPLSMEKALEELAVIRELDSLDLDVASDRRKDHG